MSKHITWQEVSDLSVALQNEILSLLKENNLEELELKADDESPEDVTYVLDYNGRFDSWTEKMVTHVGMNDDDLYLKVYDNIEGEESTIYASEMSLATRNPCWLVSIRDNMLAALETDYTDKEYAELNEQLHQAEQDILQFMLELLKKKGRISLGLSEEEEQDDNNFPITTTLYGRHDTPRIKLTDVYLSEGDHLSADGIDAETGEKRSGFYVYSEQYADVFHFIGHCIYQTRKAMAIRTIYLTVRLDLSNPDVNEITDDDVEEIVSEVDYEFRNYGNYEIESEICGQNDEGGF